MIFNMTGGGTSLNFKVVGGTTEPSNPKENTIWVNTGTTITDWVFSATKPTAVSGRVWIQTGTSSTIEFNALKKNGIQVYPIFAKQYVSGAWVDKTAKSYQNGKWVAWYGVPSEYKRVEYLEASGGQWINTGVVHVADTKIEAEVYAYSENVAYYETFFGSRNGSYNKNAFVVFKRYSGANKIAYNRSGAETEGSGFVYNEKVKLVVSGKTASYYKDDTLLGSVVTTGSPDNGLCTMVLFNTNSSTSESGVDVSNDANGCKMRLYSFKMWNSGELVRDFIPCYRISDNVAGLYDFINGKFYQNSGTGSFVVGEDV